MEPTAEQIAKLPKWAQERIRNLERALFISQRTMTEFCDSQTPSRVWYDELICDKVIGGPSSRRVYIQSNRVTFGRDALRERTLIVQCDSDEEDVYLISADGMLIRPKVSNMIEIKVVER